MAALVDTHVHLNSARFEREVAAICERARAAGVHGFVVVGYDLASSAAAIAVAREVPPPCFATVGLHPHEATQWEADQAALRTLMEAPEVVALGEMGFDFYRNRSPEAAQRQAFRAQLALAATLGKPVVIHDREAHAATLAELRAWVAGLAGRLEPPYGVLHCFSGDLEMARECIDLGFLISLAGPVTYPKSEKLAAVARAVPIEALVLETDAPYLPPQPWRGQRNEPSYLRHTAEYIAALRGITLEELATVTSANAARLFRQPALAGKLIETAGNHR